MGLVVHQIGLWVAKFEAVGRPDLANIEGKAYGKPHCNLESLKASITKIEVEIPRQTIHKNMKLWIKTKGGRSELSIYQKRGFKSLI